MKPWLVAAPVVVQRGPLFVNSKTDLLRAAANVSCRSRKRFPPPETQRRDESFASIANQGAPIKTSGGRGVHRAR